MSYSINLQHIIFRTSHSVPSIPQENKRVLLTYINSVSNELGAKITRMNAHLNHIHILVDIPVTLSISEYVRKIKQTSSSAFKGHQLFPQFDGWARGYGSFSVSYYEKDHIANYINGQDEHHRRKTFPRNWNRSSARTGFHKTDTGKQTGKNNHHYPKRDMTE